MALQAVTAAQDIAVDARTVCSIVIVAVVIADVAVRWAFVA